MHADPPLACALTPKDLTQRLAWIHAVTASSLLSHEIDGRTLRLTYRAQARAELEHIVASERECCSFLTFALRQVTDAIELTIQAPAGLEPEAVWLFDEFLPRQAPAESRKACGCAPGACG